jgi:hypothetical protein
MELHEEISRGQQAKELMEHPLFREAVETLRTRYMDEWAASPVRDPEGREKIWMLQKSLSAVESHVKEVMETGKLARIQWEQEQTRSQRVATALRKAW